MEQAVCDVCKDIRIGKILIQTNFDTGEPEVNTFSLIVSQCSVGFLQFFLNYLSCEKKKLQLYYLRLPKDIKDYKVVLMDATVATGAAAMMAIRVLLDHEVLEGNILVVSLLMAESGKKLINFFYLQIIFILYCFASLFFNAINLVLF